jgi:hypothetical protein
MVVFLIDILFLDWGKGCICISRVAFYSSSVLFLLIRFRWDPVGLHTVCAMGGHVMEGVSAKDWGLCICHFPGLCWFMVIKPARQMGLSASVGVVVVLGLLLCMGIRDRRFGLSFCSIICICFI